MAREKKPNELHLSRIFDAPVKMVWDAWVDDKHISQWWGPRGFTLTTYEKNVKTGGIWHYMMHGPDGTDYPNKTVYLEVEKHSRLVYDHGGYDDKPPLFRVTVTFEEIEGKTHTEFTMAFPTPEAAAETKKFIKQAGGDSTWDRLSEYLAEKKDGADRFIVNRTFAAPIETVFDMWTNPKHLLQWSGPKGSQMEYLKADIRSGGESFYCMQFNGMAMYGKAQYREITKPNRLVYTQFFCEKDGTISRHPMAPTWPETMITTVLFTPEGPNATRVTLTWEVYGQASAVERETFNKAKGSMNQGWGGSFDELDEYILSKQN